MRLQEALASFADNVASHENQARSCGGFFTVETFVDLLSAEARHLPIAQGQIIFMPAQVPQSRLAVGCSIYLVTVIGEYLLDQIENGFFVIDDEDSLSGPCAGRQLVTLRIEIGGGRVNG